MTERRRSTCRRRQCNHHTHRRLQNPSTQTKGNGHTMPARRKGDTVSGVAWQSDVKARGNQTEGRRLHDWQATPNQRQAKASPGRWCRVNVGFLCDGRRVAIPASVVYPSISPFIRRTHGSCTTHVTPHDAMRLKVLGSPALSLPTWQEVYVVT